MRDSKRYEAQADIVLRMAARAESTAERNVFLDIADGWKRLAEEAARNELLSVHPDRQKTGVGAALVQAALDSSRDFGCHGVLVLGDPAYYGRFGFSATEAREVSSPSAGSPAFQALALEDYAFARPLTAVYP